MSAQPHVPWAPSAVLTHPYGHGHSRVLARPDTDSPMLLAYWAVTVTRYSVPTRSPRSTVLVSRGPTLTWAEQCHPLIFPRSHREAPGTPRSLSSQVGTLTSCLSAMMGCPSPVSGTYCTR